MQKVHSGFRFTADASDRMRLESAKILFQYLLMILASSVCGAAMNQMLSDAFINDQLSGVILHFEGMFLGCDGLLSYLRCLLRYSMLDLISLAGLFACSFSIFNYVISDLILVFNGFRLGFCGVFLTHFLKGQGVYSLTYGTFFMFWIFRLSVVFLLLRFAFRGALWARKMKSYLPGGRKALRGRVLISFVSSLLFTACSILMLNTLYCVLIRLA